MLRPIATLGWHGEEQGKLPGLEWPRGEATSYGTILENVPTFSPDCRGGPLEWNCKQEKVSWGRNAYKLFDRFGKGTPSIEVLVEFLRKRPGPDGKPILTKFGEPALRDDGWYRLPYQEGRLCPSWWVRAWHGCKLEGVYSIAYHGRLNESSRRNGGRVLGEGVTDAPGVYVHKDDTAKKAEFYMRWSPLCGDGYFWAAKWEVRVDRYDHIKPPGKTDQWIQPAHAVQLIALWVCGRSAEHMQFSAELALKWDPTMEANPL